MAAIQTQPERCVSDTLPQPGSGLSLAESRRVGLLYHFCRLQLPAIRLTESTFRRHLERTYRIFHAKSPTTNWSVYLEGLYALDWSVCVGCLEGLNPAWEILFNVRTGRSDCLLVDALRARAVRLYPRDEERQETAVAEFWSNLIVSESETSLPILARFDGQRPLAPWLIRVFQNWHLSKLRHHSGVGSLPDDEIAIPLDGPSRDETGTRWHESFVAAARDWLDGVDDEERVLLGLRWRYRMSQREVAGLLGLHEGSISRRTDKLRDRALTQIGERLMAEGWSGEDLEGFVLTELGAILTDDPRLAADHISRLLAAKGKRLPENCR